MEYKGYTVIEDGNKLIVDNVKDFDPVHTFECGQCFRWISQKDGSFTGVAKGRVINVKTDDSRVIITNSNYRDFIDIWYDYFDLGKDYSKLKETLCKDDIMREAVKFGWGIRLLRQDIHETLVSFIISANNRIPMIMKVVDTLSKIYGDEMEFDCRKYHAFPTLNRLSESSLEQLELCRAGFRCKYIIAAANMVANGTVNLEGLSAMSTDDARDELMKIAGVGPKVADCIMLFSGIKYDVFPTDVWVKRVMEELYFKRPASLKEIQEFARDYFGNLAGIAQQYLFYYARERKIGAK